MPVSHPRRGFGFEYHVFGRTGSILKGLVWPVSPSPQLEGLQCFSCKEYFVTEICLKKPQIETFHLLRFFPQNLSILFHPRTALICPPNYLGSVLRPMYPMLLHLRARRGQKIPFNTNHHGRHSAFLTGCSSQKHLEQPTALSSLQETSPGAK